MSSEINEKKRIFVISVFMDYNIGVASSKKKATELVLSSCKKHHREDGDYDIQEFELDKELREL